MDFVSIKVRQGVELSILLVFKLVRCNKHTMINFAPIKQGPIFHMLISLQRRMRSSQQERIKENLLLVVLLILQVFQQMEVIQAVDLLVLKRGTSPRIRSFPPRKWLTFLQVKHKKPLRH